MLTAVVTRGSQIEIAFVTAEEGEGGHSEVDCEFELEEGEASEYPCAEGPSPLAVEAKELAWGAGAFIVLAVLMRFWLFPAAQARDGRPLRAHSRRPRGSRHARAPPHVPRSPSTSRRSPR